MSRPLLRVLHEDEWIIAVDKEAGHLVHPADDPKPDDIVVMKQVRDLVGLKIYPTHRLDRPTCGVLLFAKNKTTARALNRAFERRQVKKGYHAIAIGHPKNEDWQCDFPLQKSPDLPTKEAVTRFQVLKRFEQGLTLLEARPETGRYHQIRKHLAHCGHPIVGDYRYTPFEQCQEWDQRLSLNQRMLLQCRQLSFTHPATEEDITIQAPTDPLFALH